jgi:nicotinate phosphoribosyltransferase
MAERCRSDMSRLPGGCRRFVNPHRYKVSISHQLSELRNRLVAKAEEQAR